MTTFLVAYSAVSTLVAVISTVSLLSCVGVMRETTRRMNQLGRSKWTVN